MAAERSSHLPNLFFGVVFAIVGGIVAGGAVGEWWAIAALIAGGSVVGWLLGDRLR